MWQAWSLAAEVTPDFLSPLLQYGVLGIVAGMLFVYARGSIAREREKYDEAQKQVDNLNEFIRTELLPKQVETALLHKQVAEALEEAVKVITEMRIRENMKREARASGNAPHEG